MSEPDIYDLAAEQKKEAPNGAADTRTEVPSDASVKSKSDAEQNDSTTPLSEPTPSNDDSMTKLKWSLTMIQLAAYDQSKMPDDDCPMPERIFWFAMRDMYARFRSGAISKERGEKEKAKAMQVYRIDKARFESIQKMALHNASMWREIEQKACAYAKSSNRSEEADAFFEAVYGCRPK